VRADASHAARSSKGALLDDVSALARVLEMDTVADARTAWAEPPRLDVRGGDRINARPGSDGRPR
jgi:hypothetical protein